MGPHDLMRKKNIKKPLPGLKAITDTKQLDGLDHAQRGVPTVCLLDPPIRIGSKWVSELTVVDLPEEYLR